MFPTIVGNGCQHDPVAVCYLIADTLLAQFVEEGIKVVVFRKQLHEADAERTARSADLYQNGMQRGGFGLDFADVPFGSSHRSLAYIAKRDGGVLTKLIIIVFFMYAKSVAQPLQRLVGIGHTTWSL